MKDFDFLCVFTLLGLHALKCLNVCLLLLTIMGTVVGKLV